MYRWMIQFISVLVFDPCSFCFFITNFSPTYLTHTLQKAQSTYTEHIVYIRFLILYKSYVMANWPCMPHVDVLWRWAYSHRHYHELIRTSSSFMYSVQSVMSKVRINTLGQFRVETDGVIPILFCYRQNIDGDHMFFSCRFDSRERAESMGVIFAWKWHPHVGSRSCFLLMLLVSNVGCGHSFLVPFTGLERRTISTGLFRVKPIEPRQSRGVWFSFHNRMLEVTISTRGLLLYYYRHAWMVKCMGKQYPENELKWYHPHIISWHIHPRMYIVRN